ncbi:MAG TPA: HEAT repeat domain-containing protein [Thermoanaerobaculia bacterium]|nr:HEAT repeat domain-containing protein [Thermoanaerobaculia bacterium]
MRIAGPGKASFRIGGLVAVGLLLCSLPPTLLAQEAPSEPAVAALVAKGDWDGLRRLGRGVLPVMARLYSQKDVQRRAALADGFYALGWESPEAKQALTRDLQTADARLRISVQYALGRVSGEADVVDALLRTMRSDPSPLFRDKAACALSYDQTHLSEAGKVRLYAGLIAALEDDDIQVRAFAIQTLQIHTGQTKGFRAFLPPERRARAVLEWQKWLAEYRAQL